MYVYTKQVKKTEIKQRLQINVLAKIPQGISSSYEY